MEPIKLSQKAEEEIVNAAKMAVLSNKPKFNYA